MGQLRRLKLLLEDACSSALLKLIEVSPQGSSCACFFSSYNMEPAFLSKVLLLVLFLALAVIFLLTSKRSQSNKLPPGKKGWPIIGESLEWINTGLKGVPENFVLSRMQKFSSQVFMTSLIGETTIVFCGSAGNKFLFSNEDKLVRSWFPDSTRKIFPHSPDAKTMNTLRVFVKGSLKLEALQRYTGIMDATARHHLETHWDSKEQVIAFPLTKIYTFTLACKLFLSLEDPKQVQKFSDSFNELSSGIMSIPIDLPGTPLNRAIKASRLLSKEVYAILKQRKIDLREKKASPTQDILSHMLSAIEGTEELADEMLIVEQLIGVMLASHDNVSAAITSIMKYLAEFPDVYNEVLIEQMEIAHSKGPKELLNWLDITKMRYSWNVACEAMRLLPPFQGTFRVALTDFTYAGFSIPKGLKLYWSTYSTHKNGDYFQSPKKFDPSRFAGNGPPPYTFTPFGGGPRMCPGNEYARLEMLVFIHNLVRKYKWKKILDNENIVFDPMPRPTKGFPIQLEPHVI